MNRQVVAGLLGLAVAGCALDRSGTSRSSGPVPMVELTPPMPSIHEAINRDNPRIDPSSVRVGHPAELAAVPKPRRSKPPAPARSVANREVKDSAESVSVALGTGSANPTEGEPAAAAGSETSGPESATDSSAGATPLDPGASPAAVTDLPATVEAGSPELPKSEPARSADVPSEGRIPIILPRETAAVPLNPEPPVERPISAAPPSTPSDPGIVRDPLLGSDPDIMPKFDVLPVSRPLKTEPSVPASTTPAPEIPSTLPAELPGRPAQAPVEPQAAVPIATERPLALRAELPIEPSPGGPSAASLPATEQLTAPPTAPAPAAAARRPMGDPLLGPDPDIMPMMDLQKVMPRQPAPAPVATPASATPEVPVVPEALPSQVPASTAPLAPVRPTGDPLLGPDPEIMPRIERNNGQGQTPATNPSSSPVVVVPLPEVPVALPSNPMSAPPVTTPAPAPLAPAAPPEGDQSVFDTPGAEALTAEARRPSPTPSGPHARLIPVQDVTRLTPTMPPEPVIAAEGGSHEHPKFIDLRRIRDVEAVVSGGLVRPLTDPGVSPVLFQKKSEPSARTSIDPVPDFERTPASIAKPEPAPAPKKQTVPKPRTVPVDPLSEPVELPPLSRPDTSSFVPVRGPDGSLPAVVRGASDPLYDPEVHRAATAEKAAAANPPKDSSAIKIPPVTRSLFEAGKPVARVGEEVITLHEFKLAIAIRRRGIPADRPLSQEEKNMLARTVLNDLIDRSVVIQEAKRELKNPKQLKMFNDVANRIWTEDELPPLLRQTASTNIYELKEKLSEKGESIEDMREQFRLEFLSRGYMEQKIGPKLQVGLPEMREYYLAHLDDFALPAQVTWREVLIETDKSRSRSEAKNRAVALLDQLRRGEDFATLAKAQSDGPNKGDGGYWQTTPGSYSVASVNAAISSLLPVGQLSQVIEGPTSFHIVRVEGRRAAGPASFGDVQDKIRRVLRSEKVHKESTAYLDKLRRRTVISSVFDDPGVKRASNETISGPETAPVRR